MANVGLSKHAVQQKSILE